MSKIAARIAVVALLALAPGCTDLDVVNPNEPDARRALADGDELRTLAVESVNTWYYAATHYYPALMLSVTADANTSNYCMGTRFNNLEPRTPYENNSGGGDRDVVNVPWRWHYEALGSANDVLRAANEGVAITGGTDKYRAVAKFSQAAALSHLALLFDSAFVVDEHTTVAQRSQAALQGYAQVSDSALVKWDSLIAFLAGRSDSYATPTVLPVSTFDMNSENLRRIANTMAALTLRLTPRTPAELDARPATFWSRILAYTDAGIPADLTIQGNGQDWYSLTAMYGGWSDWIRTDYRRINRMDAAGGNAQAAVPHRYGGAMHIRPPGNPAINDQRLGDGGEGRDYRYVGNVLGDPGRGVYMQSAYFHARYAHHAYGSATAAATAVPYILKAELDLLRAEALIRSGGSRAAAAALVNGTRVSRGGLTPLTGAESESVLLAAIDHERDIELANTNAFELFYARSAPTSTPLVSSPNGGRLQAGTLRHFPVPARELEILGKRVYTYGGLNGAELLLSPASLASGATGTHLVPGAGEGSSSPSCPTYVAGR